MKADLLIAIVHYHLRRGGVTRVIQNAVAALTEHPVRVVVCCGEPPPDDLAIDAPVLVVDGLGYDEDGQAPSAAVLLDRVRQAIRAAMGDEPDLWHIHNHALGKNAAWTGAVSLLSRDGHALLLQAHDFAEDGRPANYRYLRSQGPSTDDTAFGQWLYPLGRRTHYAVLNHRDEQFLRQAGIPAARLHLLPNAVWTGAAAADLTVSEQVPAYRLYPTRAIRRKNIGEFLFWSAWAEPGERFGITLAPESPAEKPAYTRWRSWAAAHRLPVDFEVGRHHSFDALMARASVVFTTSVAEGFGLAFLEPWLLGKPLAGRDLPEITAGFAEVGVAFEDLYTALTVPLDWVDTAYRSRLEVALEDVMKSYGRTATASDHARAWQAAVQQDRVEFGRLDESAQERVIRRIQESIGARSEVTPTGWRAVAPDDPRIERQQAVIREHFNLPVYGRKLMALMERVLDDSTPHAESIGADAVLNQFLAPERFCLLRT